MTQVISAVAGYRFDGFHLDARNRQLWRDGKTVPLSSKYFDVLLMLVSRGGELVEKQRIFDEIWDGVFVTDAALTQCIKDIRRQLGDDASNPRYIKTVPKHGYVFIGKAVEAQAQSAVDAAEPAQPATVPRPYKFLDYYTEQFRESGFRGPLNRYRNSERDFEQLAPVAGKPIAPPMAFLAGSLEPILRFFPGVDLVDLMRKQCADLRLVRLFEGAGHWLQQERPAEVNAAMLRFLTAAT